MEDDPRRVERAAERRRTPLINVERVDDASTPAPPISAMRRAREEDGVRRAELGVASASELLTLCRAWAV
eukprot:CAMPEP_0118854650 /NCGR_PEP_ID=MMETSP1163-20130328/2773_1 /TAXON_ID=124430 /ORGANISM="Phaeomonas parva, Strain CCMP2877" /LENGTH=69 /DNA_ID=CAMNT_0006787407 /DNA_START=131 /DNA_END=336 /DNA_ORIENTATION=+